MRVSLKQKPSHKRHKNKNIAFKANIDTNSQAFG